MSRSYGPGETVDFAIVGSGAAGGVLARELSRAGFDTVVLEQGPRLSAADFHHDEIHYWLNNALMSDPQTQPQTYRRTPAEQARVTDFPIIFYAHNVGGSTVHFTGNYWRFHENDFDEASRLGPIAGTGFADWPIDYAELEPYYTRAEWEIGVSGLAGASPFDPPRTKPYPMPPLPVKSSGVLFERGARKLGLHPFPAPMAINSQAWRGRPGCVHCGFCMGFGCEVMAKSSTLYNMIPEAEATGHCEVRPRSYVSRIETDARGRCTGVAYFDAGKQERFQKARAVVLCANGAETPRLLLLSESGRFPDGLANSSGLVGKYLMFNANGEAGAIFEGRLNEYKSVQVTRIVHDFYDADPRRGFYGGGGMDARILFHPIFWGLAGLPREVPRWGEGFKAALREYPHAMFVAVHATSLPQEANSITLDPDVKDAWGLAAPRTTYSHHRDDLATVRFLQDRGVEILEAAGARKVWPLPVGQFLIGAHLLGTCRMGDDPASSVVDRYHRSHDVPNLFICDGSSFVTSGRGQPTLTIQALAFRAAEHIARFARDNEI